VALKVYDVLDSVIVDIYTSEFGETHNESLKAEITAES
jgi:hypothetical protein